MKLEELLLPDERATDLLAAMLVGGDAAREAGGRGARAAGAVMAALAADAVMARSLLALLHDSVRRNALEVDPDTATYLRSARLTESLRGRTYREIVAGLASRLDAAGVPFLLIKGASTGVLYYADPALRHAHDIEILAEDATRIAAALAGGEFLPAGRSFVHRSGLPLRVHTRVEIDAHALREAAIAMPDGIRTPDATHSLALAIVHAGRSASRRTGRWACDALAIVRGGGVEWGRFVQAVSAAGGALPAVVQLRWLRDVLDAAVPDSALSALAARAARAGFRERAMVRVRANAGRPVWWRRLGALVRGRVEGRA